MALASAVQNGKRELPLSKWCVKRFFYRPVIFKTTIQCFFGQTNFLCPLLDGLRFSVIGNAATILVRFCLSLISVLFGIGRPSAIIRGVRSIVVDTVKTMFGRGAWAHVGEEILKAVFPAITDGNAASSPIGVIFSGGIETPFFHALPCVVFGCVSSSMFSGGFVRGLYCIFLAPTTTTNRVAALQIRNIDDNFFAAVANATPVNSFPAQVRRAFSFFENKQFAESLSGPIFKRMAMLNWCGIIEGHKELLFLVSESGR